MNLQTWQTIWQFSILAGIIITAFGGFSSYLTGNNIDKEKDIKIDDLLLGNKKLQKNNEELKKNLKEIKKINEEIKKRIRILDGILTPDNKPTPVNSMCTDIPNNAIMFFLGNSLAYTRTFPHTIIEVGGQPLLVIDKQNENITVSAKFFSADGNIVAELKDNRFFINPNNYFRIERPDEHTLIVYDQQGNQNINIHFLNQNSIKLLGQFHLPNRPPIIISEEFYRYGGMQMSGVCFGDNGVDIGIQ